MNIVLGALICFVLVALVFLRGFRVYVNNLLSQVREEHRKEMEAQRQLHRQEFQELINKINHEGPIPEASTGKGLTDIILLGVSKSIKSLLNLLERQDWNTAEIITDLQINTVYELRLLSNKLDEFLISKRKSLKDYDKNQLEQ